MSPRATRTAFHMAWDRMSFCAPTLGFPNFHKSTWTWPILRKHAATPLHQTLSAPLPDKTLRSDRTPSKTRPNDPRVLSAFLDWAPLLSGFGHFYLKPHRNPYSQSLLGKLTPHMFYLETHRNTTNASPTLSTSKPSSHTHPRPLPTCLFFRNTRCALLTHALPHPHTLSSLLSHLLSPPVSRSPSPPPLPLLRRPPSTSPPSGWTSTATCAPKLWTTPRSAQKGMLWSHSLMEVATLQHSASCAAYVT